MPRDLIVQHIYDPSSSWMCGRFGAVAEFHRDPEEPASISAEPCVEAVTERGAIRIETLEELRPVAYETIGRGMRWGQGIALCLPETLARMPGRTVVTELGPDTDALREQDRDAVLFDLGLGGPTVEVCVRTANAETASYFRRMVGRRFFDQPGTELARLPAFSPHRVFRCRLGRVEVYQPIPPMDGRSPAGPHTHVRGNLLALGRNHAATVPVPQGWIAGMTLYPAHPLRGPTDGRDPSPDSIDLDRYAAFQSLMERYGDPAIMTGKRMAWRGGTEDDLAQRDERVGFRIAQRQRAWLPPS